MKKSCFAVFLLLFTFCLSSCGAETIKSDSEKEKATQIEAAVEIIRQEWAEIYTRYDESEKGYLEIKNTRVVTIQEDAEDIFSDINQIVEFILYTDYYGSAPYYSNINMYDTVVFYRDGSYEIPQMNPLLTYRSRNYVTDFSGIIEAIEDFGADFNSVFNGT